MSKPRIFIGKGASPTARKFIVAALSILYDVKTLPVLRSLVTGSKTLAQSAAPFIATLVMKLQAKLGPLSPQDLPMVVLHISGEVAELAKKMGDPAAKDLSKATAQIMLAVKQMIQPGQGQAPPAGGNPSSSPGTATSPAGGAPMQQLAGAA